MRLLISGYSYPGLLEGFRTRGWEVVSRPDLEWWAACWGGLECVPAQSPAEFSRHLLQQVEHHRPDLVVIGKGYDTNRHVESTVDWYWKYQLPAYWCIQPGTLAKIRERCVLVQVTFDSPDDTMWATNCRLVENVDAIGACNHDVGQIYSGFGMEQFFPFFPAWDEVERGPLVEPRAEDKTVNLVFIGSPYCTPNPEFGLPRRDVIRTALSLGLSVELYGNTWDRPQEGGLEPHEAAMCWKGPAQPGNPGAAGLPMHEIFRRGDLTYTSFLRRSTMYWNDRVPIAMGSGTFCLMEQQRGLDLEFLTGVHTDYHRWRDQNDLAEKLAWWLHHPVERQKAARAAQRLIFDRHTYRHRADELIHQYEIARKRKGTA